MATSKAEDSRNAGRRTRRAGNIGWTPAGVNIQGFVCGTPARHSGTRKLPFAQSAGECLGSLLASKAKADVMGGIALPPHHVHCGLLMTLWLGLGFREGPNAVRAFHKLPLTRLAAAWWRRAAGRSFLRHRRATRDAARHLPGAEQDRIVAQGHGHDRIQLAQDGHATAAFGFDAGGGAGALEQARVASLDR